MPLTPFPDHQSSTGGRKTRRGKSPLPTQPNLAPIEEKDKDGDIKVQELSSGDTSPEFLKPSPNVLQNEKQDELQDPFGELPERELQLDPFGLPLSPQPLGDPLDPLTWSRWKKIKVLIHISAMSFLSQFLGMSISSALWPLHKDLHVTLVRGSYVVGTYIAFVGVAPFLWNPLGQRFGRRPLFITCLLGTVVTAVGSGLSTSYPVLMTFRSINGFFAAIPIGLGSVVVCDLFYQHERGLYMGIYMVVQMTGGNLGPMVGGYIYKGINWHWCFFTPAIVAGLLVVSLFLLVPETLYSRGIESLQRPQMSIYQQELIRKRRADGRQLKYSHFIRPFKMLRYPSIVLPSIYYSVASGYANNVFVVTSAFTFHHVYHFRAWQTGLLLGGPLTLGSWIGEFGAGGFSDWVTERRALGRGGKRIPEDRLYAMLPGVLLAPLGLVIEGFCIHNRTHWIGPGLGIAIASAGLQIVTTVTYAYTAECYPRQTAETATILNFGRQIFCFCVGFYAVPFAHKFSLQTAWIVFAIIELVCYIPMIVLMWKGAVWRDNFGGPDWNLDL